MTVCRGELVTVFLCLGVIYEAEGSRRERIIDVVERIKRFLVVVVDLSDEETEAGEYVAGAGAIATDMSDCYLVGRDVQANKQDRVDFGRVPVVMGQVEVAADDVVHDSTS